MCEGIWVKLDKEHWCEHVPKSRDICLVSKATISWNKQMKTDGTVPNNKPNITIRAN